VNTSFDVEFDFEALKWVSGPLYTRKRDEWLTLVPDARARLARYEQDRDWRTSVTALILLGWLDHRSAYEALFPEIEESFRRLKPGNIMGNNVVWGAYGDRARLEPEFAGMVFPLCLEVLLKRHRELAFHMMRTFLEMLQQMKDERAIEPVLWYMQNVAQDESERGLGTFVLRLYPTEPLRARLARLRTDQQAVVEVLDRELDDRHLPWKK
jgi:hypothetical protein